MQGRPNKVWGRDARSLDKDKGYAVGKGVWGAGKQIRGREEERKRGREGKADERI